MLGRIISQIVKVQLKSNGSLGPHGWRTEHIASAVHPNAEGETMKGLHYVLGAVCCRNSKSAHELIFRPPPQI